MSRVVLLVVTLLLLACSSPAPAPAAEEAPAASEVAVEITEWQVPWEDTRPRDPYVGPQGRVWFVGQQGDYLAYLDPATGEFTRFDLEAGTGPHNLIVDDEGHVWYAGNRAAHRNRPQPNRFVGFDSHEREFLGITEIDSGGATVRHMFFDERQREVWFGTDKNTIGRAKVP